MYSAPQQRNVLPGTHYTFNLVHRNKTTGKSQWQIVNTEELLCFVHSQKRLWVRGTDAWGLYFTDERVDYLGTAQDHVTRVFVAKFVNDPSHNNWHGYPADHQNNNHDVPEPEIIKNWLDEGILSETKLKKLQRMKPCTL